MASTVFPAPSAGVSLNPTYSVTAAAANTLYSSQTNFSTGVYVITCASGTISKVTFFNGNAPVVTATTSSGTTTINLSTAATRIDYFTNTGTDVIITITNTASVPIFGGVSGTLDTITATTSTYAPAAGRAWCVVVGGGGAGGSSTGGYGTKGGGSGGINGGAVELTGSNMTVTVGAGGIAQKSASTAAGVQGGNGGTTTFGTISATGGQGGGGCYTGNDQGNYGGAGGTPGGGEGGYSYQQPSASLASPLLFVKTGTTGGGSGANFSGGGAGTAAGSGIGTGGQAYDSANPGNPSGYGGGGAGSQSGGTGSNGGPGVVYVLRDLA